MEPMPQTAAVLLWMHHMRMGVARTLCLPTGRIEDISDEEKDIVDNFIDVDLDGNDKK